ITRKAGMSGGVSLAWGIQVRAHVGTAALGCPRSEAPLVFCWSTHGIINPVCADAVWCQIVCFDIRFTQQPASYEGRGFSGWARIRRSECLRRLAGSQWHPFYSWSALASARTEEGLIKRRQYQWFKQF